MKEICNTCNVKAPTGSKDFISICYLLLLCKMLHYFGNKSAAIQRNCRSLLFQIKPFIFLNARISKQMKGWIWNNRSLQFLWIYDSRFISGESSKMEELLLSILFSAFLIRSCSIVFIVENKGESSRN